MIVNVDFATPEPWVVGALMVMLTGVAKYLVVLWWRS